MVVVLTVTEGDGKPLKYSDTFFTAVVMILTKIDLLRYADFDVDPSIQYAK